MARTLILMVVALAVVMSLPPPAQAAAAGVQTHLLWNRVSSADIDRKLDDLVALGADYARVDVGWSSLEKDGPGQISTSYRDKLDQVVAAANQRGIELILTFWETPCWASSAPESLRQGCDGAWWDRDVQRYPPRDPAEYARALATVVERYGDRVAAWEVWNEPNHPDFLKSDDQVADYAALLKAAYPAAKAAHPGATILGGSLADADFEFTEALLQNGVAGHFDGWSIHPYSADLSPLYPNEDKYMKHSFIRGVPEVRRTLVRYGAAKPVWLTEFGWSTCNLRTSEGWRNGVDEPQQAEFLKQAYRQAQEWPYVPVAIWFNHQDTTSDPSIKSENFGLRRFDGSRKPAWWAFQAVATMPRLSLDATGNPAGIRARGQSRAGTVAVRLYRYLPALGRYALQPAHTFERTTDADGWYGVLAPADSLRAGKWKVEASATVDGAALTRYDVVRWGG